MNLNELTLTEMINGLSAEEFSASEIATAVIDRIEATSDLGAIIEFDKNFYKLEAAASDKRRKDNEARPLDGVPLVL